MSDKIKYEFIQALDEFEELSSIFDALQAETVQLKEQYRQDPNNPELLEYIKNHEKKYKEVYEKFQKLNSKSKEILKNSNDEKNGDSNM